MFLNLFKFCGFNDNKIVDCCNKNADYHFLLYSRGKHLNNVPCVSVNGFYLPVSFLLSVIPVTIESFLLLSSHSCYYLSFLLLSIIPVTIESFLLLSVIPVTIESFLLLLQNVKKI